MILSGDTGGDTMADTHDTVSLSEAARLLGISPDAARKRVLRGSLPAIKDVRGEWRVFHVANGLSPNVTPPDGWRPPLTIVSSPSSPDTSPPTSASIPDTFPFELEALCVERNALHDEAHAYMVTEAILQEVREERDYLRDYVRTLHEQTKRLADQLSAQALTHAAEAERADTERSELRRLLGNAQMQLAALIPAQPDTRLSPPRRPLDASRGDSAAEEGINSPRVYPDVDRGTQASPPRSAWARFIAFITGELHEA